MTECVLLQLASPYPFERPLGHLRAGSSTARSGPALNPLPAAWNGWQQTRDQRGMKGGGERKQRGGGINKGISGLWMMIR